MAEIKPVDIFTLISMEICVMAVLYCTLLAVAEQLSYPKLPVSLCDRKNEPTRALL